MEALQRQAEEVEEKELLKINEEKIARLIIENQLIQPKLKHFEAKQQVTILVLNNICLAKI